MDDQRRAEIMEYLKLQWTDIHHSRKQDWQVLLLVLGVCAALVHLNTKDIQIPEPLLVQRTIAIAGVVASLLGAQIALGHWQLFRNKMSIISTCEHTLGLQARFARGRLPVQWLILMAYLLIAASLLAWATWLPNHDVPHAITYATVLFASAVLAAAGQIGATERQLRRRPALVLSPSEHAHPYWAGLPDLEGCLRLLGERPVKLIADTVRPEYAETPWTTPAWKFRSQDGHVIQKPLLPNIQDGFQLSIAGRASRQDEHEHAYAFDMYAAITPMTIHYEDATGTCHDYTIPGGVLIVPPGIRHRVELTGTTFVFQAAMAGRSIHNDKAKSAPRATALRADA